MGAWRAGRLRIYLGAAPGVGKTYAMLEEGAPAPGAGHRRRRRLRARPTAAPRTARAPRRASRSCRASSAATAAPTFERDGPRRRPRPPPRRSRSSTSSRTPTPPAARNEKRWQDVDELLDAGIDVISTVNIQHLESLNDVVERDHRRRPARDRPRRRRPRAPTRSSSSTWPRRRCAAGWRTATSTRPRRSTPRWRTTSASATSPRCASSRCSGSPTGSTRACERYRAEHGIDASWQTRERVVVALTGGPEGETLLRRGARIAVTRRRRRAARRARRPDRRPAPARPPAPSAADARLVEELGGDLPHRSPATTSPRPSSHFARASTPPRSCVGVSRRGRWRRALLTAGHRRGRHRRVRRHRRPCRHPPLRRGRQVPDTDGPRCPGAGSLWGSPRQSSVPLPSPRCSRRRAAGPDCPSSPSSTSSLTVLTALARRRGGRPLCCGPAVLAGAQLVLHAPRRHLDDRRPGERRRPRPLPPRRRSGVLRRPPQRPAGSRGHRGPAGVRSPRRSCRTPCSGRPTSSRCCCAEPSRCSTPRRPPSSGRSADRPPPRSVATTSSPPPTGSDPTSGMPRASRSTTSTPWCSWAPPLRADRQRLLAAYAAHAGAILSRRALQRQAVGGRGAEPRQPGPHRPAVRRLPRPTHAARRDQGRHRQPPIDRGTVHDRRTRRSSRPPSRSRQTAWRSSSATSSTCRGSRSGRSSLTLAPTDLAEAVPGAIASLGLDGSRVRWSLDPAARRALADPGLLERVLANLARERGRYQPAGEPVQRRRQQTPGRTSR